MAANECIVFMVAIYFLIIDRSLDLARDDTKQDTPPSTGDVADAVPALIGKRNIVDKEDVLARAEDNAGR